MGGLLEGIVELSKFYPEKCRRPGGGSIRQSDLPPALRKWVLVHGFRLIHRQDIYLPFHFATALRAGSFLGYFSRQRRLRHGVKPGLAFQTGQGISHQFLRHLPVEDFLHGQGDDDFGAALEERFDFLQRIRSEIERHEEALLAIFTHHHGFKGMQHARHQDWS
jgi:hypothetical protein